MKKIGLILDFVCPYCYLGEKVMHLGLGEKVNELEFEFFPYELNPEPNPLAKVSLDRAMYFKKNIAPWAASENIPMNFPSVDPVPRTALAFEALHIAKEFHKDLKMLSAIMDAYWLHSKNIGDVEVLSAIANEIGLDSAYFEEALKSGKYKETHRKLNDEVADWDFEVVPTFYLDGERLMEFPRKPEIWAELVK